MQMIIIEGGLGVGKSTLTKALAERINGKPFFEPVETNPYLELYYQNPKQYALPMQFYLMSNRFELHQQGIEHVWKTKKPAVFDRSIYGDSVFAKRNWLDGNMSQLDFENYEKMRKVMFKFLMVPHVTLFLKCEPETCLDRIKSRSRGCEQNIPISYLNGLNDIYKEMLLELKTLGSNVVEIDWNKFGPVDQIVDVLKQTGLTI